MSLLRRLSDELATLVARVARGVVGVRHRRGQGSGVVLAEDGYIVTNSHVARSRGGELRVRLSDGEELPAERVGADDRTDLAVLRVAASGLAALPFDEGRLLRVGELVVAIGNPLGLERSMALGVVSALERDLGAPGGLLLEGLVQTDAAVNPGNSGGPLLDAEGALVGLTTVMIPYAQGIGFAIPARTASWVAAVLIQRGEVRRPWLGIAARGEALPVAEARLTGFPRAVRVMSVESAAPAGRAGLAAGDLLLRADGQPLYGVNDLQRVMVLASHPDVHLELLRGGERRLLEVRPDPAPRAA